MHDGDTVHMQGDWYEYDEYTDTIYLPLFVRYMIHTFLRTRLEHHTKMRLGNSRL